MTSIKNKIDRGLDLFNRKDLKVKYVPIDDTFPKAVINNINKYRHLIKEADGATSDV